MSSRGRPVNCHLHFASVEDALTRWLEEQIDEGSADDLIWDLLDDMRGDDFKRTFGSAIEVFISDGVFDEAVKDRAEGLGYEKP